MPRKPWNYWTVHALLPALLLALASLVLMGLGGDFVFADHLYRLQGDGWAFQDTYLADNLIHRTGRNLSVAMWLVVVVGWAGARRDPQWAAWRRPLAYLALASLLGVVSTSLLKSASPLDCPWDLLRYGGKREFIGLFGDRPASWPGGGCFPAGHASAGYAWMALYFFLQKVRPGLRFRGLALGLCIGLVFGLSQQFRGAHFLSHDLWAAATCWFVALWLDAVMFGKRRGVQPGSTRHLVPKEFPVAATGHRRRAPAGRAASPVLDTAARRTSD